MVEREKISVTLNKKTIEKIKQKNEETGIPVSQQLERAWVKVYDSK